MPKIESPESLSEIPLAVLKNSASLAVSGFGVVVALAWNEVIQKAVTEYIDPYLGKNGGMVSLLIYAMVITIIAVMVTMQLSKLEKTVKTLRRKDAS